MTVAESKGLKKGSCVYWRGDATDGGIITEMSWDAVTITTAEFRRALAVLSENYIRPGFASGGRIIA